LKSNKIIAALPNFNFNDYVNRWTKENLNVKKRAKKLFFLIYSNLIISGDKWQTIS
jgi:hypothetical protein